MKESLLGKLSMYALCASSKIVYFVQIKSKSICNFVNHSSTNDHFTASIYLSNAFKYPVLNTKSFQANQQLPIKIKNKQTKQKLYTHKCKGFTHPHLKLHKHAN